MMAGPLTQDARTVPMHAYEHAIRLGHRYLGGEHFLLALADADQQAGAVLRERGVTPARVEAEIVRLSGSGLFGDLDREALTAIGIDVEAVRACVEASFGQEALRQADQAVGREAGAFSWSPRRRSGAWRDGVFLPHGPGAEQSLRNARREAQVRHAPQVTLEDLAIGLLAVSEGLVPHILSALGVPALELRAAIVDRYRQAN